MHGKEKMAMFRIIHCHLVISIFFFVLVDKGLGGISCYVCSSTNGSDINCEDPYHPALSTFAEDCQVPKEGHIGQFPANYCVKIIGTSAATKGSLMIRTCVLENMDSQCGVFKFGGDHFTGCILTCNYDGCNPAPRAATFTLPPVLVALIHLLR
ncbi:U-scoloptoxin(05)-Sm1a-like isoform X2 [Panulirus ornatus]|uniref:U-scoloptoxin(05)-Sm1a-like isoform X2 n=1 Tax=Panulirus ornatus TaxID=150431 RepID=UPI003A848BEC